MNDQHILEELGLQNLPAEKQEEALASISRIIYQGVLIRVMENLSDAQKAELEKLIDQNSDEDAVYEFLATSIPDLDRLVDEEVMKFKADSLAVLNRSDSHTD